MANVTIKTNITNTTDSASTNLTASLVGVPNTGSTIISNRTFAPKTNCKFTKIPHVSFEKTSNPNNYNYSVIKNANGSYSFTVNYFRPVATLPTTDIIEFFAVAKTNVAVSGKKIYDWSIQSSLIQPHGEKRKLRIIGDPTARLKISVTENPREGKESNAVIIVPEFVATIGSSGVYEITITFPSINNSTALNKPNTYRILLSENTSGTFIGKLIATPTVIYLQQWPLQQTKLQIIETGGTTWTLPSSGLGSDYYLYSSTYGSSSNDQDFSFSCIAAAGTPNITADGVFEAADFTQTTASNTLSATQFPTVVSNISYKNLSYTIDTTATPDTVVITGKLNITHGYDGNGHTYVTLNINDILNQA